MIIDNIQSNETSECIFKRIKLNEGSHDYVLKGFRHFSSVNTSAQSKVTVREIKIDNT